MKQMSRIFLETITYGADACRWCVQQCPDEEKYEILVTCISIKNEFSLICRRINLVLGKTSPDFLKNIIAQFEKVSERIETEPVLGKSIRLAESAEEKWRLPGCSQIFLVAQSLGQNDLNV
jgi:hypothetical protein